MSDTPRQFDQDIYGFADAEELEQVLAMIEDDRREVQSQGARSLDEVALVHDHVPWLIAELRAALSREEEAKKDAERLARGLNDALRLIDAASPFAWHNGNTHNGIDEGEVLTGRFLESIRASALSHSRRTAE